ncbi:phosphotransferase enzyme family protein [Bifidobacterium sp.]|jgi:Ser/Thr protein kinase RdoA (MazF antagonist)|uniref:phosphotransferase enzyme family protein n=1 Tax=Bifidobacterium sp. TaxID=41200 RepID=UPI0025B8CD6E|nr:phosphotransferase [Bifidobacterium sp.]MCH4209496.1 phosphotransferase [Bifidobacterium sp.]MCI1225272.1 phosphotransferase [Bifidobacterium sp.]
MKGNGDPQLEIVAQHWPNVEAYEAQALLRLSDPSIIVHSVASYSGRPTAAASLVHTSIGLIFIKRYARCVRDASTIEPYHRYAAYLADHGIATPSFLRFHEDEESVLEVPGGTSSVALTAGCAYEAYLAADGSDRYGKALTWDPPRALDEARQLGRFLAAIDVASAGFEQPALEPNGMSNAFGLLAFGSAGLSDSADRFSSAHALKQAVTPWLEQRPGVRRYLELTQRDIFSDMQIALPYGEAIAKPYATLHPQWTHGDPHISNFLWQGDRPCAVIDFGLADCNTAVFDLAMLLERHAIQWVDVMNGKDDACRPDVMLALLEGYCAVRPLSDAEKAVLPGLLPICQVEAGLNWIQYYMNAAAALGGACSEDGEGLAGAAPESVAAERMSHALSDADWCYDACFLAHTCWFGSGAGRRLLDTLRSALA